MDVFISRPTWVSDEFKVGLNVFLDKLKDLQLNPRTLGSTDYPIKSPLDEVIKIMDGCRGAVILGYPQIIIEKGIIKDKIIEKDLIYLPTEWNHIEAGLAYARKLPLIVVHHKGVCRGIFDRGTLNSFIFEKDFSNPTWSIDDDFSGALRKWRNDVLGFNPSIENTSIKESLNKIKDQEIKLLAINRRIKDSQKLGSHKESALVTIKEMQDHYVIFEFVEFHDQISIPYKDMTITYDTKRNRPMIELRAD